jgi:hypothetical protein
MAANQTGYTLTLIPDSYDVFGKTRTVLASIAPTASSYYTGGYLITPQNVGFRLITDATYSGTLPGSGTHATSTLLAVYDVTNQSLQLFGGAASAAALAEFASAGDASGYVFLVRFYGN